MLDFAETSRKGIPSSSASCWPRSVETTRLSSQSHLFPIRILFTPSVACCSTLENQVLMSKDQWVNQLSQNFRGNGGVILLKERSSVTS